MFLPILFLCLLAASSAGDLPLGPQFARRHGGAPFTYGARRAFPGVAFASLQAAPARIHVPASGVVYGAPGQARIYGGPGPAGFHQPGPAVFAGGVPAALFSPPSNVIGGRPAVIGFVGPVDAKINPGPAIVKTVVTQPAYAPHPYSFGYDTVDEYGNKQYRHETSDANNARKGSYGYTDTNGLYRQVDYIADANGFRAIVRTNEPGTAPSAPAGVLYDAKPVAVKPAAVVKAVVAPAPTTVHAGPSLATGPALTSLSAHPAAFGGRLVAKVAPGPYGHGHLFAGPVAPRPVAFLGGPGHDGGHGLVGAAIGAPLGRFHEGPGGFVGGPVATKLQAGPAVIVSGHGPAFAGHHGFSAPAVVAAGPALGKVHAGAGVHPGLHANAAAAYFARPHPHHFGPAIVKAR